MAPTNDSQRQPGTTQAPKAACVFTCPEGAVRFQDEGTEGPGRFSIAAYDGGITKNWYWGNLALDLEGLTFASKRLPVLDSHWTSDRLGFTTKQDKDGGVTFEGQFLKNSRAQELRADMQQGFPMQASLRPVPLVIEEVRDGATAQVNGRTLKGPGSIFRRCQVQEVSMCVFGALKNTKATAMAAEQDTEPIEFELLGKDETMSDKDKPALTLEAFQAEHPQIYQAAHAAGVQAERQRFAALQKACGDDVALAAECFAAGLDVAEALGKANEKLALEAKSLREQLAAHPPTPPADPVAAARAEFKAQPAPAAAPRPFDEQAATDEELQAHFAATRELRDQFSSAPAYVAYVRHTTKK